MDWGFPESVSTFGERIDALYGAIFITTAIAFVLVEALLIYFAIRYRHREGRRAEPIHGNTKLEIVWTVVPFVGVMFIAILSASVWLDIKSESRIPAGALRIGIQARQFEWSVTYPGPDGQLNTQDDFNGLNQLHVPVGRPVQVSLTAEDVIHAFYLPQFRVKQDAVPGTTIQVWFEATQAGEYELGCAELCGLGHYRMRGMVTVHSAEDYEVWQADEAALAGGVASVISTDAGR
jgi:cytochrome c oxidase subunit II